MMTAGCLLIALPLGKVAHFYRDLFNLIEVLLP